ncbi:MAG: hypothetical protein Q4C58_13295 [Eubacteriales bacterium]|nr:hypothetical protein [Eubacteriales bacterium]
MDIDIMVALISGITSILVVVITQLLLNLKDRRKRKREEIERIQKEYINPLRFLLAENYFRIEEALNKFRDSPERTANVLVIRKPEDVCRQELSWFTGSGCYLISNCYYTACLFALLEQIREKVPYLKLSKKKDTRIMFLINNLVVDFRHGANIYYVIQRTIGRDLYSEREKRVLTYKEFCSLLRDQNNIEWYATLIWFYLSMNNWNKDIIQLLLEDLKELTEFLDDIVSGGNTIDEKVKSESERGKNYG